MIHSVSERIKHSSLASKITLLGLITIIVTLVAGLLGLSFLYIRYKATEAALLRSRQTRIEFAISTLEKEQSNFAHDYGIWDEMAEGVINRDLQWLEESFIGSHETFGTDVAKVYTIDDQEILTSLASAQSDAPESNLFSQAAQAIKNRNDSVHLHSLLPNGDLWHISAGPIASHTDQSATIAGKIVMARKWDEDEKLFIENILDAKLSITDKLDSSMHTSADLVITPAGTEDGKNIYYVTLFGNRTLFFLWDTLRVFLLITLFAGTILIIVSHRLEYLLILNPLTQLTDKLRKQSVLSDAAHTCPNEIEMLDQLIEAFLAQGNSLKKLSRIVDESTNAVALTDLSGSLTYVNPSWERLNGYASAEVLGKNPRILKSGKTPQKLYVLMWETLLAKKPFLSREFINRRKDGSEYFCFLSVFPILENGRAIAYAAIQQDISQEKEVDRMKTEFISMASHQLRTPLSAMRWFGELLLAGKGGDLSDKQKEMISNLQTSTMRMIALVNALLDITRLESGRIIIEPEPTDLDELVRSLLVELTPRLESKKLTLKADIPTDIPTVNLDKKMIREVYANLLTNAIKYTPEGGTIMITVRDTGNEILSTVKDSGLGIPVSERAKVFTKFYRGSNVQRVETDGTGLGLYLVKAIIESSAGKVWFESTVGVGTTFSFSLPKTGMVKKSGSVRIGS